MPSVQRKERSLYKYNAVEHCKLHSIDWLIDWMNDWMIDWLIDWLTTMLRDELIASGLSMDASKHSNKQSNNSRQKYGSLRIKVLFKNSQILGLVNDGFRLIDWLVTKVGQNSNWQNFAQEQLQHGKIMFLFKINSQNWKRQRFEYGLSLRKVNGTFWTYLMLLERSSEQSTDWLTWLMRSNSVDVNKVILYQWKRERDFPKITQKKIHLNFVIYSPKRAVSVRGKYLRRELNVKHSKIATVQIKQSNVHRYTNPTSKWEHRDIII